MDLAQQEEQIDHFSELIDDCVYPVFDWLPLNDLCTMGVTSKKFRIVAESQFRRRYPALVMKNVDIVGVNGIIEFWTPANYVTYFSQLLKCITVYVDGSSYCAQLIRFVRANCCRELKKIVIGGHITKTFVQGIADMLQKVEIAELNIHWDLDALNHFPTANLKHLKVRISADVKLPKLGYPHFAQLKTLEFHVWHPASVSELERFLQVNRTIKRFVCILCFPDTGSMKQIARAVAQTDIEELLIDISSGGCVDFNQIQDDFERLDARENFKQLELNLLIHTVNNLQVLRSLKKLTGFHLIDWDPSYTIDKTILTLNALKSLTALVIDFSVQYENVKAILSLSENAAVNLPNLCELYFNNQYAQAPFHQILTPFIRNSDKLIRIVIRNVFVREEDFDLSALNKTRKHIKNAGKVIVYLPLLSKSTKGKAINAEQNNDTNQLVILKQLQRKDYSLFPLIYGFRAVSV